MPLYEFVCLECKKKLETIQGVYAGVPFCCGKPMNRLITKPAVIRINGKGGTRTYSRGYKEGYAKDYQKSVPAFEPKS
jgi:predicted nucleic acid-binding Zn ribbon protein